MRLILVRAVESANLISDRGVLCKLTLEIGTSKFETRVYVPLDRAPAALMAQIKDLEGRTPEIDAFVAGSANEFQFRRILREFADKRGVTICPIRLLTQLSH